MVKYLRDEFDLLFSAVDLKTGESARVVLSEQGMTSMLHSRSVESDASLGAKSRWFQLFVPKGSRDQAREHLDTAWGPRVVAKLL